MNIRMNLQYSVLIYKVLKQSLVTFLRSSIGCLPCEYFSEPFVCRKHGSWPTQT